MKQKKVSFRDLFKPLLPFTVSKAKEKLDLAEKSKPEPSRVLWDF